MLGLAVMDAETLLLPDLFTLPGLVAGVVFAALRPGLESCWLGVGDCSTGGGVVSAGCCCSGVGAAADQPELIGWCGGAWGWG